MNGLMYTLSRLSKGLTKQETEDHKMEMNIVYEIRAKRHSGSSLPDICLFYDEDRNEALKFMRSYVLKNGFTVKESNGVFTVGDILLRKRTLTGDVLCDTPYINLFDSLGNRR